MRKLLFYNKFISCLYMFRAHVFIIRRSKLHSTASGIITPIGGRLVHDTATYRCDDTRGCVMQFWPPDDEHMCSKHVEAWNKLIVQQKFCASSWLITEINDSCINMLGCVYLYNTINVLNKYTHLTHLFQNTTGMTNLMMTVVSLCLDK